MDEDTCKVLKLILKDVSVEGLKYPEKFAKTGIETSKLREILEWLGDNGQYYSLIYLNHKI
jgi:hypothetical protein